MNKPWTWSKLKCIRAFVASKAFYGGISLDQIMQVTGKLTTHLQDITWSDNDNKMYLLICVFLPFQYILYYVLRAY